MATKVGKAQTWNIGFHFNLIRNTVAAFAMLAIGKVSVYRHLSQFGPYLLLSSAG